MRASGQWFEGGLTDLFVAGFEAVDPETVYPVAGGDLGDGLVLGQQRGDNQAGFGHAPPSRSSCAVADDPRQRVADLLRHLSPMS